MLDIELALELMKKYGYSSTTVHPYLYEAGDSVGICYTYLDEDYGTLERVKLFDSLEAFEEFLKQLDWVKKNGLNYHVRMCLDNYEAVNPKTLFLRNEKLMIEGEMDDIETYDLREKQREQMSEVSKLVYEAGDLLLIYDEVKKRQMQYLLKVIVLKNQLRQKYYDLQKAVDEYNKIKIDREIVKIPEVPDSSGIDITMEIAIKDRYNLYIVQEPTLEEAISFLREVWDLNKNLELNIKYYDALREETDIRNEMKIVDKKIELMDQLNENVKPLFGADLMGKFKKINKTVGATIGYVSKDIVQEKVEQAQDKYKYYDNLDSMYIADYLREAFQNSNYADLAIKYGKGTTKELAEKSKTPLNEIAANLLVQYKSNLTNDEQAILVIYNNEKFRKICNAILAIPKFNTFDPKQIVKRISSIKDFSKLKSECYISLRDRIDNPLNQNIKNSLFRNYDFTTFESFIASLMRELAKLKDINNKMFLTGDINMYLPVSKLDGIKEKEFILVTNDLNSLLAAIKGVNAMIGITLLKEKLPVLYSPYFLDLGDIYNKEASPKIEIREMVNLDLLIEAKDCVINIDKAKVYVTNYYSELEVVGNVSIARDIKSAGNTTFVKYAFLPSASIQQLPAQVPVQNTEVPIATTVTAQPATQQVGAPNEQSTPVVTVPTMESAVQPVQQPMAEQPVSQPVAESAPVAPVQDVKPVVEAVQQNVENVPVTENASQPVVEPVQNELNTTKDAPVVPVISTTNEQTVPEVKEETKVEDVKSPIEVKAEEVKEDKQVEDKKEEVVPEKKEEQKPETEENKATIDKPVVEEKDSQVAIPVVEEKKEEPVISPVQEEVKPVISKESNSDLDRVLDTIANTMPKDQSKGLEDTSKMAVFSDLVQAEQKTENKTVVQPKIGDVNKGQVIKKVVTGANGSKKVMSINKPVNAQAGVKPVKPMTPNMGMKPATPVQGQKPISKPIGQPGTHTVVKSIANQAIKHVPNTSTKAVGPGQARKVVKSIGQQGMVVKSNPSTKIVKKGN